MGWPTLVVRQPDDHIFIGATREFDDSLVDRGGVDDKFSFTNLFNLTKCNLEIRKQLNTTTPIQIRRL